MKQRTRIKTLEFGWGRLKVSTHTTNVEAIDDHYASLTHQGVQQVVYPSGLMSQGLTSVTKVARFLPMPLPQTVLVKS